MHRIISGVPAGDPVLLFHRLFMVQSMAGTRAKKKPDARRAIGELIPDSLWAARPQFAKRQTAVVRQPSGRSSGMAWGRWLGVNGTTDLGCPLGWIIRAETAVILSFFHGCLAGGLEGFVGCSGWCLAV